MRKFPSIKQFRHVVEAVTHKATYIGQSEEGTPLYDGSLPKPVLTFSGTTKLHGTNGGVAFDLVNGGVSAQSKERILALDNDNQGFCAWVQSVPGSEVLSRLRQTVEKVWGGTGAVSIHAFGEWCGPLVNSKTAIGQLSERFVLFGVLVTDTNGSEHWLEPKTVANAFYAEIAVRPIDFNFICDFKQWHMTIDFNNPGSVLPELERLTMEVEASCPAAKELGGAGIGEGIVWVCDDPVLGRFVFKTAGEKHKGTKTSRLVDIAPEVLANREAFVDAVLTPSRLEQGFEFVKATHGKVTLDQMGVFLQWVGMDVLKEESDTLNASGLERKDVMGAINRQAKSWVAPRLAKF